MLYDLIALNILLQKGNWVTANAERGYKKGSNGSLQHLIKRLVNKLNAVLKPLGLQLAICKLHETIPVVINHEVYDSFVQMNYMAGNTIDFEPYIKKYKTDSTSDSEHGGMFKCEWFEIDEMNIIELPYDNRVKKIELICQYLAKVGYLKKQDKYLVKNDKF